VSEGDPLEGTSTSVQMLRYRVLMPNRLFDQQTAAAGRVLAWLNARQEDFLASCSVVEGDPEHIVRRMFGDFVRDAMVYETEDPLEASMRATVVGEGWEAGQALAELWEADRTAAKGGGPHWTAGVA
jgi:hypothetical protein